MDLMLDVYASVFDAAVVVAIGLLLYGVRADTEQWKEEMVKERGDG